MGNVRYIVLNTLDIMIILEIMVIYIEKVIKI